MSTNPPTRGNRAGARHLELVCLGAVLVLALVQVTQEYGHWAMLTVMVGVSGLIGRWSIAPLLLVGTQAAVVLAYLIVLAFVRSPVWGPSYSLGVTGAFMHPGYLIQSAAILTYTASHYRLQGLTRMVLPVEAVAEGGNPLAAYAPGIGRPSARPLVPNEAPVLVLMALGMALAAEIVWNGLPDSFGDLPRPLDRLLALVWLLGTVIYAGAGLIAYQGRAQASPQAARLYLLDQLWAETRGEQRWLERCRAWARVRRQRREGRT